MAENDKRRRLPEVNAGALKDSAATLAAALVVAIVWIGSGLMVIGAAQVLGYSPPGLAVVLAPPAVAGVFWYLLTHYRK